MRIFDLSEKTSSTKYSSPPGLSAKRFEGMLAYWGKIAKYRESASIYYYGKPTMRLLQLQECPDLYKKYFGDKKLGYIDAEQESLYDADEWIELLEHEGASYDALFILGMDQLLFDQNKAAYTALEHIIAKSNKSYLFFYTTDFSNPIYEKLFWQKTYFFQNTHIEPLLGMKDARVLLDQLSQWWGLTIPNKIQQEILDQCGTHYTLIKHAVRTYRDPYSNNDRNPYSFSTSSSNTSCGVLNPSLFLGLLFSSHCTAVNS